MMKPIAIFQHTVVGAPGSIASILENLGRPYRVIRILDGEAVPSDVETFGGMIFMGGYMSVHDDLQWITQEQNLIRQAVALDIPVAGHCLGSQLLASALGANVRRNTRPEIGWQKIIVDTDPVAEEWWGCPGGVELLTFQWHGDTFDVPAGAVRIATSAHCRNQAFVFRGLHLGIQSHLEMTPLLIELSLERNGAQLEREVLLGNPSVTTMQDTRCDLSSRTEQMHAVLARLYHRWLQNCR